MFITELMTSGTLRDFINNLSVCVCSLVDDTLSEALCQRLREEVSLYLDRRLWMWCLCVHENKPGCLHACLHVRNVYPHKWIRILSRSFSH